MYFERLERRERQIGREGQNGQGKNGKRGQGRRDQQRPFNDRNDRRDRRNQCGHRDSHENRSHRRTVTDNKKQNDRHDDTGMWCKFHKTKSHNSSECFALKKQREEHKPAEMQKTVSSKNKYPRFEEESSDSDSDSNSEIKLVGLVVKKHTSTKLAPLRIKVQLKNANGTFEALLDSGASVSIINQKTLQANVQLGRKKVASSTKFQTVNGEVTSDGSAVVQCRFASLKTSAIITHRFEILEKSQDAMVIGRDIMTSLGIVLEFKEKVVQWDGHYAHLNTGGSHSFEVSDYEFLEESKEIAESAVRPEELMPDTLPNSLVDEYHQLFRDN
uniref:Peptidase A2 domain-containing protein n=1 Tax=Peronospora matthiolae TaxID=2874970 RepID=A0AAV1SZK7_9STRA